MFSRSQSVSYMSEFVVKMQRIKHDPVLTTGYQTNWDAHSLSGTRTDWWYLTGDVERITVVTHWSCNWVLLLGVYFFIMQLSEFAVQCLHPEQGWSREVDIYDIPWKCYERSNSEFYLSISNRLVFNQRLQLFVQSPQPYLLIFAWRN